MSQQDQLAQYEGALLNVFGRPSLVIDHGDGPYLWDVDGTKYLDLLGGIAVNALGHNHPALVSAISKQAAEAVHVSNFFTTRSQIELARKLLEISGAPEGSRAFFANSGTEAIEAAMKIARRTGRPKIVAAKGAFHGRTMGALSLTHKEAYRAPFEPLVPGVEHVEYGDADALREAVDEQTSAVVLEPIQGEGGVIVPDAEYLRAARQITTEAGALLVIDEIQTGIGRTGRWFGHQHSDITPDVVTVAKGLGGGVPIGAVLTMGPAVSALLTPGQHGTTFGGNPLACAAGLAVLDTIERDGLLEQAVTVGGAFRAAVLDAGVDGVKDVRGRGLLVAIEFDDEIAPKIVERARAAGFVVNAVSPTTLRLAPPLIITAEQLQTFADALPTLVQEARA